MRTTILTLHPAKLNALRWLAAVLLALGLAFALTSQAEAAACSPTRLLDLWARTGTLTLPDSTTVNIWGYTDSVAGAAQLPGPALSVNEGECVQVTLHNDLAEATSLALHGQGLAADTVGAASGGTAIYTFSAARPGTFLYEAGLTLNGARQVGMGLYGALIVQPATAPTTYSSEAVLVLSEIDLDLAANPTGFDMGDYKPEYWLINGQGYSNIPDLSIASGSTALIRYVNAGLNENSMGLLGLDQQVVAADGFAVPAYTVVAETIPPGATLDTLVTVPAAATVGTQYALYSTAQHLDNNSAAYGGQLMFVTASAPLAPIAPAPLDVTGDKQAPPADSTPPIQADTPPVAASPVDVNKPDVKTP